jgi:hypothetical protein
MKALLALSALLVHGAAATAQAPVDSFAQRVRESTARYLDQQQALQDGYRRIGPDFPSMGEHWLNRAIVMRGEIDPLYPPILEYITVKGKPVLAGVAYARLAYAEAPVSSIPAPVSAWHFHAGSVDEESFIASHARHGAGDSTPGPRIAVLHAWLWVRNPAGLFATDNWMLPWLRLGVEPPTSAPGPDSLTLTAALAAGGEHYFATLLRLEYRLGDDAARAVAGVLRRHSADLRETGATIMGLGVGWSAVEAELRSVCGECSLAGGPR